MMLSGIVLGGFLGSLADGISFLSWLNFGQSFGLDTPLVLSIRITMAGIIGVIIALLVYHNIR